ncbi:MAG TPA: carboxypeptidase regulatory-like domain-containing protein [Gemmatimonadaceae bacterium]|nr:carboxypeptidase regulatory-like domain-containing protein [Gemmatimonadaceae bacterium]
MTTPLARAFIALCAFAVATGVATAGAQKPTLLFGVVTNVNGVRLQGVELLLANSERRVVTNDSGKYVFEAPPAGQLRLMARRIGFRPLEKGFKLAAGDSKQLDFELEGIPDLLDSVLVLGRGGSARMADFWNRRKIGVGAFITHADIERRKPYRPSDLLRTIAGVRVDTDMGDGRPVIRMGRTPIGTATRRNVVTLAGDCRVNYYLDGHFVPMGTFHMDDIPTMSIEAIEIFRGPSETPAAFRQRETACGVISIWTREPPPKEKPDPPFGWSPRD